MDHLACCHTCSRAHRARRAIPATPLGGDMQLPRRMLLLYVMASVVPVAARVLDHVAPAGSIVSSASVHDVDAPLGGAATPPVVVYVSPNGSDTNPGTSGSPLRSMDAARVKARQYPADTAVTVEFGAGDYPVVETVRFGPEDSGAEETPRTYTAAAGAAVTLTAEVPVTVGADVLVFARVVVTVGARPNQAGSSSPLVYTATTDLAFTSSPLLLWHHHPHTTHHTPPLPLPLPPLPPLP